MASLSSGSGCYLLGGRTDPPSNYCYYCHYYEIKPCFYELCNGSKRGDLSDLSKRHRFVATSSEGDLKKSASTKIPEVSVGGGWCKKSHRAKQIMLWGFC